MILTGLSTTNRVMMPKTSPELATLSEWFAQFHDGLGIGPVRVVADERYGLAVLRLALLHGDRVARVVILSESDGGSDLDGTLSGATSDTHPVLFMAHDRSADDVLMETQEFLLAETPLAGRT